MTQFDKAIDKFYKKPVPNNITYDEVIYIAEKMGCTVVGGGKHPIKVVHRDSGTIIPIPRHSKYVKEAYIKQLKDLFDELR